MSTVRSPVHNLVAADDRSRIDNYFSATGNSQLATPSNSQKRQRPESAGDSPSNNETSTEDMIRETLKIVKRMDARQAEMDTKILALEESVSFQNAEIDNLKLENLQLKSENAALALRMDAMEDRMEEMDTALERESEMRDNMEANGRLINLELSGIPKKEGEKDSDCKAYVGEVMKLIGSENDVSAVDVAHRKYAGGIIIKFKSRDQRNEVYLKRFNLVGKTSLNLGFELPEKGNDLYLNESLSFDRSRLMKDIRDRLKILNAGKDKDSRIKAKTSNGVIQVQNSWGKFIKISKMQQFNILYPQ